ncbi:MAG: hypothetical protein JWN78_2801 [Bacteroidota bacterium]|nr:hypothetical protein [Bacteroidota bacterium]
MRWMIGIMLLSLYADSFAIQSLKGLEKYNQKYSGAPCVQAFLNSDVLNCGSFLSKKSKGILTVSKDNISKIYFNVTLKSNIGKKDEPPIYLRFIKQKQLDINELLEYAGDGDEIYIEEFVSSLNKIDLNCVPANFTVSINL